MHERDELDDVLWELHRNTQKTIYRLMRIAEARLSAGLTQADIAKKMGISEADVADIEKRWARGDYPEIALLKAYAKAVGKELDIRLI